MAASKFKPKVSSNLVEGATPVEDTEVTMTPDNNEDSVEETSTPTQEDSVEVKVPDTEEKSEKTEPTITFESKDSDKKPAERNVKVCLKSNHSCTIGGVSYHFEKGKQVNVPLSVKAILMQADLLMPL